MSHPRETISSEVKKFIVSIKQYFDRNKPNFGQTVSSSQMTAGLLGNCPRMSKTLYYIIEIF